MFLSYRVSDGQQIVCCADTKRDYNKNAGKSIAKFARIPELQAVLNAAVAAEYEANAEDAE